MFVQENYTVAVRGIDMQYSCYSMYCKRTVKSVIRLTRSVPRLIWLRVSRDADLYVPHILARVVLYSYKGYAVHSQSGD